MKFTEGLLKRTFEEIAPQYSDIEAQHIIIDNCAHQLVKKPEQFDVIVTTNMNGDIISDLSSALIGGLGFAPSANIGNEVAIFEAVHGSAPKYAGKNVINPLAVLFSAVLMLRHLQFFEQAASIEHSVFVTLQEGKCLTRDIVGEDKAVSTSRFTEEIIANLGRKCSDWHLRDYKAIKLPKVASDIAFVKEKTREVVGADIFIESPLTADELGKSLETISKGGTLTLKMISNRGTKVYPPSGTDTDCVDHWFCRFTAADNKKQVCDPDIADLLQKIGKQHKWMHVEKLQVFDGQPAFTKSQGED